jgi:hypothetical protein
LTWKAGFPPADAEVRDWLLQSKTKRDAFTRAGAFMCAVFVTLYDRIRTAKRFPNTASHVANFSKKFWNLRTRCVHFVVAGVVSFNSGHPVMVSGAAIYTTTETNAFFAWAIVK